MIKLMFEKQSHYFVITIDGKTIQYMDNKNGELWGGPLPWFPPQYEQVKQKIMMSRNKIPAHFLGLFFIPKWELKEFEDAKDENELKALVLKDAERNGCKLVS